MKQETKDRTLLKFKGILDLFPEGWIAGGCLRDWFAGVPISEDIDVFFPDYQSYCVARDRAAASEVLTTMYTKDHLSAFRLGRQVIQLIGNHFFPGAKETAEAFDFTVCCVAMDSKEIYYHPTFFEDLSRRYLGINKLPFPLSTLERLTKYAKKGYYPCNGTLLTIANGIREIPDINDPTNTLTFYSDGSPRFVRYD